MNEVFSGGLGSYSVVCLAVSFLQMHPKIKRGEIDPSKNLGVLIMEFFELYGCFFNYHEVGISIRDGGSYFNKAQRGWLDYGKAYLLSIEDPGDPGAWIVLLCTRCLDVSYQIMMYRKEHMVSPECALRLQVHMGS
jgi:DNA polymerase sigma